MSSCFSMPLNLSCKWCIFWWCVMHLLHNTPSVCPINIGHTGGVLGKRWHCPENKRFRNKIHAFNACIQSDCKTKNQSMHSCIRMHSITLQDKKSVSTQHAKSCFPSYTTATYFSELFVVLFFGSLTCRKEGGENNFEKNFFSWDKTTSIKTASCLLSNIRFSFHSTKNRAEGEVQKHINLILWYS